MTKKMENYEVIIVGGGPVGATLAVFLASYGVSTLVLERDAENPRIPRAFSFDDETMRMLQSFGIRQRIVDEACHEPACVTYHATAAPGSPQFLRLESTRDLGNGYGALQFFHQPYLERILGEEFASRGLSSGNSAFRRGIEVTRVECFEEESPGHCKVYYRPAGDTTTEEQCTSAKFVVGCDGKTGIVRNSVLAGKVDMEGDRYPEAWVTVSAIVNSPPKDFILFHPPYNLSADNVYALFFPPEFRFICDPARPSISSRVGPPKDRQYRWEWMVMPGDHRLASSLGKDHGGTRDEASIEVVKEIMRRHGMLRTQLSNGVVVEYPWESLDIVRNQVYRFDMRIAKEWRFGRLFLAGDSAHTMPPFMGQGMNSGIRDAYGLAWRLAWCLRSPSVPENLLVSYTAERRPHTRSMLKTSIAMGAFFALQNTFLAQIRNLLIKMLTTFVPPVRRFLRYMKFKPLPRYDGKDGNERTPSLEYREIVPNSGFFLESGGWMIPQVWIRGNEAPRRLDNVLFLVPSKDTKIRFVALAVFAFGNLDESFAGEILAGLQVVVDAIKPTTHDAVVLKAFGLALPRNGIKAIREDLLAIVADKSELPDGAASEGYDSERIHAEIGLTGSESNSNWLRILFPRAWVDWIVGANDQPTIKYLVLRPDRYVFSVSESLDELKCSLEKLFM